MFPRRCPVCDRVAPFGKLICVPCSQGLEFVGDERCCKCGKSMRANEGEYCYDCSRHKHDYDQGRAIFEYESIKDSIYRYKFRGRAEYARFYGEAMAKAAVRELELWKPDAILPVPLHKSKMQKRGFNQALQLGRELAKITKIPCYEDVIVRTRKTIPMKELGLHERQINIKNAFIVRRYDVKLKRVVIVDDIYTTGSTIDAIARELKKTGVEKVYFLTLAIGTGL